MLEVNAQDPFAAWPPRDFLLRSLVEAVPKALATFHPETGRFGTDPWICRDQNVIFPLAAAWSIEDPANRWYHDPELLSVIAKGGDALVADQDKNGKWIFRKKDGSTWGQIHMPWTYSRWIRAYQLVRDALPEPSRSNWEKGLLLGFKGIRRYADGGVHNIPAHHAMALYIAGRCFENDEWCQAAATFMGKVVEKQARAGFWSEHFGPVVGYNFVYVDALGVYYALSRDPEVFDALQRAAHFHSSVLWPDGSCVSCVDERMVYSKSIRPGNVGFSWVPEGRGFLLKQLAVASRGGTQPADADLAAALLLYGGEGEVIAPAAEQDTARAYIGEREAVIQRRKPWQWAMSGYACKPYRSRWIQDRHNLLDVYHDAMGVVVGGGNTKLQPYWSTFTVGDPATVRHTPGDEDPDFTPDVALLWTPDSASVAGDESEERTRLDLRLGSVDCSVTVAAASPDALTLTYTAPPGARVEAHVPLLCRSKRVRFATGARMRLTADDLRLSRADVGEYIVFGGLKVTVPAGASLRWPERQHNPYKKGGGSGLSQAKLVLVLPFEDVGSHTVQLSYEPALPFEGLAFEARDLPVKHSEGTYTKRLDGLGSQFLGSKRVGDWITFTLPSVQPGSYELLAEFVMAYTYGIVRVLVDGKQVGAAFDGYCPGVDSEGERVSFGLLQLSAGEHELTVEITGRNPAAENHLISVKRWLLSPSGSGDR